MTRSEVARAVIETLSRGRGHVPGRVKLALRLSEVGADSLDAEELVIELEERLGRPLGALDLARFETVGDLVSHLQDTLAD